MSKRSGKYIPIEYVVRFRVDEPWASILRDKKLADEKKWREGIAELLMGNSQKGTPPDPES